MQCSWMIPKKSPTLSFFLHRIFYCFYFDIHLFTLMWNYTRIILANFCIKYFCHYYCFPSSYQWCILSHSTSCLSCFFSSSQNCSHQYPLWIYYQYSYLCGNENWYKEGKSVEGQIYIPAINVLLMICCVLLVIGFRTSENLASAYGVAVCGGIL